MTNKKEKGFSLLELAIVMIIIGLLAVGITGGQRLIKKANLSRAQMYTHSAPVVAIDDLELWLESTLDDSFEMNGTTVAEWVDMSGNNNNATEAVAADQPTIVKNDSGIPMVTFDGSTELLTTGDSVDIYTIFIVADISTTAAATASVIDASGATVSGTHKINKTADGTAIAAGTYRVNGAAATGGEIFTDGMGIYAYEANALGSDSVILMANQAGTVFTDGAVAEVIVYSRALDADEIADIEEYLSKKYKIAI